MIHGIMPHGASAPLTESIAWTIGQIRSELATSLWVIAVAMEWITTFAKACM